MNISSLIFSGTGCSNLNVHLTRRMTLNFGDVEKCVPSRLHSLVTPTYDHSVDHLPWPLMSQSQSQKTQVLDCLTETMITALFDGDREHSIV